MTAGGLRAPFPPAGYRRWRAGPHDAVAWEPAAEPVRAALAESGSLYDWAAAHSEREVETGRGRLFAVRLGPLRAAVRHYRRGGWIAPLLDDRYFDDPPRPFAELAISEGLRQAGVSTPRVLAGVVTRAAPGYRADLATEWLEPGLDLVSLLAPNHYPDDERAAALAAAGETVGRAHRAGLDHPDLNPGNVFVQPFQNGWSAALLDLDRARITVALSAGFERRNLRRFQRAIEKACRQGRLAWGIVEREAFQAGYERGYPRAV
ncbi:MAG TPA: lipopolysaccharide kinase InaA family protein [Gemmatimonadota bacterium]|nr:lipopolysaccharide kinase InaA family protein [Gemmatimonadota bacterium]